MPIQLVRFFSWLVVFLSSLSISNATPESIIQEVLTQLAPSETAPTFSTASCAELTRLAQELAILKRLQFCGHALRIMHFTGPDSTHPATLRRRHAETALHQILAAIPGMELRRQVLQLGASGVIALAGIGVSYRQDTASVATGLVGMVGGVAGVVYTLERSPHPTHPRAIHMLAQVRTCLAVGDPLYFRGTGRAFFYPTDSIHREMSALGRSAPASDEAPPISAEQRGCELFVERHRAFWSQPFTAASTHSATAAQRRRLDLPVLATGRAIATEVRGVPQTAPNSGLNAGAAALGTLGLNTLVRRTPLAVPLTVLIH